MGPALVLHAEARAWPTRVGALAWVAFEELALAARADEAGWIAAAGVRDLAAATGVNKDTASRAVAALATAGLITRERVGGPGVARRSAYRLHLPSGIELQCPTDGDRVPCPQITDTEVCPNDPDSIDRPKNPDANVSPNSSDTGPCPRNEDSEEVCSSDSDNAVTSGDAALGDTVAGHRQPDGIVEGDTGPAAVMLTDSATAGCEIGLSQPQGRSGEAKHRQRRRGCAAAQNEAQGQLFENVTAPSQDPQ